MFGVIESGGVGLIRTEATPFSSSPVMMGRNVRHMEKGPDGLSDFQRWGGMVDEHLGVKILFVMYEWLLEEMATVKTRKFYLTDGPMPEHTRKAMEDSKVL